MNRELRAFLLAAALVAQAAGAAAQEATIFLSSSDVTDVAVAHDAVYWSSEGGAGIFREADSTYASLTKADGLGSNRLTATAVDSSGNVWFGTADAGVRWRGSSSAWHVINTYAGLPSNQVTSLDAWASGVWIGTPAGASLFAGDTRIETVTPGGGLAAGAISAVAVDSQNRIWFATAGGLSVRDAGAWTTHFPGTAVRAVVEGRDGRIWAATATGVYRYDGLTWALSGYGLPDPDVFDFAFEDTVLWAGSEGGPARYDEASGEWTEASSGLAADRVVALASGAEIGLWVGIQGEGVAWWDGTEWRPRRPSRPATNHLISLDTAPGAGLWCGTGSEGNLFPLPGGVNPKGLVEFTGTEWRSYRQANSPLPLDNVYRVARDGRGGVWMGTWGAGLLHFDPAAARWDTLSIASGDVSSNHISALVAAREGRVWFAEYTYPHGGIAVVDTDGTVTHFGQNEGMPTVFFRSIAVDSAGRVWAGSYGLEGSTDLPTLVRLDTSGTLADKSDDELMVYSATLWGGSVPVHALACGPDGGVWIGVESGIAWTDGSAWLGVDEACAGGVTGQVRSVAVDRDGTVWIASSQGLGEWRDGTLTVHRTDGGGLAVDDVMSLAYDRAERTLWIGTWGGGVSRWVFERPDTGVVTSAVYAFPNPFRPGEGHDRVRFGGLAAAAEVEIYTLDGQSVATVPGSADGWAATDGSGEPVASGLYVFVGKDDRGRVRTGKIAVIR